MDCTTNPVDLLALKAYEKGQICKVSHYIGVEAFESIGIIVNYLQDGIVMLTFIESEDMISSQIAILTVNMVAVESPYVEDHLLVTRINKYIKSKGMLSDVIPKFADTTEMEIQSNSKEVTVEGLPIDIQSKLVNTFLEEVDYSNRLFDDHNSALEEEVEEESNEDDDYDYMKDVCSEESCKYCDTCAMPSKTVTTINPERQDIENVFKFNVSLDKTTTEKQDIQDTLWDKFTGFFKRLF